MTIRSRCGSKASPFNWARARPPKSGWNWRRLTSRQGRRTQRLKILDRAPKPFFQADLGFPAQHPLSFGNIRLPALGIILRKRFELQGRSGSREPPDALGELQNG